MVLGSPFPWLGRNDHEKDHGQPDQNNLDRTLFAPSARVPGGASPALGQLPERTLLGKLPKDWVNARACHSLTHHCLSRRRRHGPA